MHIVVGERIEQTLDLGADVVALGRECRVVGLRKTVEVFRQRCRIVKECGIELVVGGQVANREHNDVLGAKLAETGYDKTENQCKAESFHFYCVLFHIYFFPRLNRHTRNCRNSVCRYDSYRFQWRRTQFAAS